MNPQKKPNKILCYYFNASGELQIIKLKRNQIVDYEKVIFSKQRLLFEAVTNSFLEIYRQTFTGTDLVDVVSCHCLQVISQDPATEPQEVSVAEPF